jgi:hypothetical protein
MTGIYNRRMHTNPEDLSTFERGRADLLRFLQAQPGVEFSASQLGDLIPMTAKFVGRSLTMDHQNPDGSNAIPGVRMREYLKPDGGLNQPAWWYSWVGDQS